jgi:hypothetical protein
MPVTPRENYDRRLALVGPQRPHYDPRQSSRSFASTASTLAGFAFTAIVLLLTRTPAKTADWQRQSIVAALFLSFFGCLTCAFLYPAVGAEEALSRRAHAMSAFAGCAFATSLAFLFWAVVAIVKVFLGSSEPGTVAYPALDTKIAFDAPDDEWPPVERSDLLWAFLPAYILIIVAVVVRLAVGQAWLLAWVKHDPTVFQIALGVAGVLILLDAVIVLGVAGLHHDKSLAVPVGGMVAAVHAALLAVVILILPS